jgi:O-antigen/teichoic acid export membrane protein
LHPGIVLVLAGTVPFVLLREFLRRFAFAHLRMGAAVLLDAAVAAVHLGSLLLLARAAVLGAVTAHAATGLSSAVVAGGASVLARDQFRLRAASHVPTWRQNWRFGKWELAGHLAIVGHAYLIHWLLAFQVGPAATGAFAACLTVVALSRPLRHGLSNLLETKTARAYAAGGMEQLRRFVRKTTVLMATTIGAFALAVAVWGQFAVDLMYGDQFADCGWLMVVLAVAVFVQALSYGPLFGLRAVARTNWNCLASVIGLGLAAGAAMLLLPSLGLLGGGVAVLVGDVGAWSVRAVAFWRCGGGWKA